MVQFSNIHLDREAAEPLYQQLATALAELIRNGKLPPGSKLPAGREFSAELGLNRATISNAFAWLADRKLVRSHVGQGTFVVTVPDDAAEGDLDSTVPLHFRFSRALVASESTISRANRPSLVADPVDFASLAPDEDLFPVERLREGLNHVLVSKGKHLLQYGHAAGYPPLREYIAKQLSVRGVLASAENVLIVNGSQQGLDLVCRALLDPGDTVVVEDPTYTIVPPLLGQYHADVHGLAMTPRGMDLDALETMLARTRPKFVFTMPTFHNPTGISMDLPSRHRLVQLASRYGVPVVEDDFDSELRFRGQPIPSLKSLDTNGSVLQIGTFSKGLFPGLRLGWVVGPARVIKTMGRAKLFADYHTSPLLQAGVLEFCQRGHHKEHMKTLIEIYSEKANRLAESIRAHFPKEVGWSEPDGGFASWVTLPEALSAEALLEQSSAEGVLFTPGQAFFTADNGAHTLRLSISKVPLERIEEGIRVLGRLINERISALPASTQKPLGAYSEPQFHI